MPCDGMDGSGNRFLGTAPLSSFLLGRRRSWDRAGDPFLNDQESESEMRMTPWNRIACAILGLLAVASLGAGIPDPSEPGLTDGDRLRVLLERVQLEQSSMSTLRARFLLRQENEMLVEPEESEGSFSYASPDRVRWEYQEPRAMTVVVNKGEMTTWYRDLGRAEVAQVGKYSDRFLKLMSATAPLTDLLDSFDARVRFGGDGTEPYRIELLPKYKRIAKRVRSMTLWIDRSRYVPVQVRIEAAGGGVTEFQFEDVEVNPELPAGQFELELPPTVEVQSIELGAGSR